MGHIAALTACLIVALQNVMAQEKSRYVNWSEILQPHLTYPETIFPREYSAESDTVHWNMHSSLPK